MIYFDSNYIIKCYLNEPGSREVLALAQSHSGRACSLHGRLEFWSGIKRHARQQTLSAGDVERVFRQFIQDEATGLWLFLPVEESMIRRACSQLATLPDDVSCRAADALHLTCAVENRFAEIYSNDHHLLAAAAHFGLKGTNVIPSPRN